MRYALLLISISLFSACDCFAAPTITVVNNSGNIFSIAGTAFGTKSPAAPLRYINFDAGTVGESIVSDEINGGLYIDGGGQIIYDNTHTRFSGDVSAQQNFNNGHYNQTIGLNDVASFNGSSKLYIHGYWYMKTYGHMPRNCKFPRMGYKFGTSDWQSRIEGENNSCSSKPSVLLTLKPECPMLDGDGVWGGSGSEWDTILGEDGQWHRFDSYIDIKVARRWTNVDNNLFIRELSTTDMTANCDHSSIGYVYFAHFWSNSCTDDYADCAPTPEAQRWWSEIYIDTTQARVEIGNNVVFADCTHREIQIPSAWSTTSITATLNTGSFSCSDTNLYLFVIDSDGVPSAGKAITLFTGCNPIGGNSHFTIGGNSTITFK